MPRPASTSKNPATPPALKKPKVKDWRKAQGRSERGRLIHEALFTAASEIVGERGYEDTSISLITQRAGVAQGRSEEHTSELQSLMRTSYAVFCLKTKIYCPTTTHTYNSLVYT